MLFCIIEEKPYNILDGYEGKGMFRFWIDIAIDSWTEAIFLQAFCKVPESFVPNTMQKPEHPGAYWLALVSKNGVGLLTFTHFMSCCC